MQPFMLAALRDRHRSASTERATQRCVSAAEKSNGQRHQFQHGHGDTRLAPTAFPHQATRSPSALLRFRWKPSPSVYTTKGTTKRPGLSCDGALPRRTSQPVPAMTVVLPQHERVQTACLVLISLILVRSCYFERTESARPKSCVWSEIGLCRKRNLALALRAAHSDSYEINAGTERGTRPVAP